MEEVVYMTVRHSGANINIGYDVGSTTGLGRSSRASLSFWSAYPCLTADTYALLRNSDSLTASKSAEYVLSCICLKGCPGKVLRLPIRY